MSVEKASSILSISSHVIYGGVGNRAAVFALERLGHAVWSMPTVILPFHPGHGKATRLAFEDSQFESAIDDLIASKHAPEIKAVLTGYFGSAAQPRAVARLIKYLKSKNPDLIYLCDPVIGDANGLYVPAQTAAAIAQHLMPICDIATPNRFEFEYLSGQKFETNLDIIKAAHVHPWPKLVITSAFPMMAGHIGNLLIGQKQNLLAEHRQLSNVPNGVGDLFSALFLARILANSESEALALATASVFDIVLHSVREESDEILLAQAQDSIVHPGHRIQPRQIMGMPKHNPKR